MILAELGTVPSPTLDASPSLLPKHLQTKKFARCVANSLMGRIVSDEWEALEEAERDGIFPEMVKAYIAGEDTEYFNSCFPTLVDSGILEDAVETYIQRTLRRSKSAEPISSQTPLDEQYPRMKTWPDPRLQNYKQRLELNPLPYELAFKQYMGLKGPPRVPRPKIGKDE